MKSATRSVTTSRRHRHGRKRTIQTPCLIVDLDAFERNVAKMRDRGGLWACAMRVHGKMHKSADVALYQIEQRRRVSASAARRSPRPRVFARRRDQGRAGLQPGARPGEDRPPGPHAEARRAAIVCVDDLANVADLFGGGAEARHRRSRCSGRDRLRRRPLRRDDDAGQWSRSPRRSTPRRAEVHRHPGLSRRDAAHGSITRTAKRRSTSRSRWSDRGGRGSEDGRPRAATSSAAAAPAHTTSRAIPASTMSCNAAPTPSWTPTTAGSSTRRASASIEGEWENALFLLHLRHELTPRRRRRSATPG